MPQDPLEAERRIVDEVMRAGQVEAPAFIQLLADRANEEAQRIRWVLAQDSEIAPVDLGVLAMNLLVTARLLIALSETDLPGG